MKAEINNKNKARFLDLYIGQSSDSNDIAYSKISRSLNDMVSMGIGDYTVKLKPLFSISDEDAVEVAKILYTGRSWLNKEFLQTAAEGRRYIDVMLDPKCDGLRALNTYYKDVFIIDFLRSRGYLIGWMGMSPEEIIKAKWVKMIENVN